MKKVQWGAFSIAPTFQLISNVFFLDDRLYCVVVEGDGFVLENDAV